MKKIFPIITVLILLSLLGLIFFQILWIQSAKDIKDKQVEDNIVQAISYASGILTQEKSILLYPKVNQVDSKYGKYYYTPDKELNNHFKLGFVSVTIGNLLNDIKLIAEDVFKKLEHKNISAL